MSLKPFLLAGLFGVAALSIPLMTVAQDAPTLNAETVTDDQISAFVRAAIALEEVRREYTQRIMDADSDEERTKLVEEADNVAEQLVDKVRGITSEEYLILSRISLEDEGVNGRVAAELDRMREQKKEFDRKNAEGRLEFSNPTGLSEDTTAAE